MEPPGWDWPTVAALATVAGTAVTVACFFIRSGFREMDRVFDKRAADRQRAWAALVAKQRRHRSEGGARRADRAHRRAETCAGGVMGGAGQQGAAMALWRTGG